MPDGRGASIARGGSSTDRLLPALGSQFHVEVLGFGDGVAPVAPDELTADCAAQRSGGGARRRCASATAAGRSPASSCCRTAATRAARARRAAEDRPPGVRHRHRLAVRRRIARWSSVTAAETVLDDSRVDLAVSAVSHGAGHAPIELRLLENGRPIEVRARDAGRRRRRRCARSFTCRPAAARRRSTPSRLPLAAGELVPENNARSVLVPAAVAAAPRPARRGRARLRAQLPQARLGGRPGPRGGLGRPQGQGRAGRRHLLHAGGAVARATALPTGYPATREALFRYDAVVLANVEAASAHAARSSRRRARSSRERGGGLLVLGARVVPAPGARRTRRSRTCCRSSSAAARQRRRRAGRGARGGMNRVSLTAGGRGASRSCSSRGTPTRRGSAGTAVPPLAAIAPLGGPRPGRERAGRDGRRRRHAARAGRRAALRRGTVDGLRRRGLVALAHAAAGDRSLLRDVLAAGRALAGAAGRRSGPLTLPAGAGARRSLPLRVVVAQRRVRAAARRDGRRARHGAGRPHRAAARRAGSGVGAPGHYVANVPPGRSRASIAVARRRGGADARSARRPLDAGRRRRLEMTDPRLNAGCFSASPRLGRPHARPRTR